MNERRLHQLFEIGVLIKGVDAVIECAAGIALYAVSTQAIVALVARAVHDELIEDPHDFVATHLLAVAQHFSVAAKAFYAAYLLGHGAIKILLVAGLLRGWLWSYPAALLALTGFVAYQVYRVSHTHGFLLIALTVFDLVIIALVWHEWRVVRRQKRDRRRLNGLAGSPHAPDLETPGKDG